MKVKGVQYLTEVLSATCGVDGISATLICLVVMMVFHFQLLDLKRGRPCSRSPILRLSE